MTSRLCAVTFDAQDPMSVGTFWAEVLGRGIVETNDGALLPAEGTQLGLGFARRDTTKVGANRMHLHLTSSSDADQQRTVDKALALGARHLDVAQRPEERHVVLADPGDNEFCVIEADNAFLAGCGFLGELACDGGREVGTFWSRALDWPLVWDQDQETAIQSPLGGTKIAWGGPAATRTAQASRQRFDLTSAEGDPQREVERLISLGAARLDDGMLTDPDGTEFRLLDLDD